MLYTFSFVIVKLIQYVSFTNRLFFNKLTVAIIARDVGFSDRRQITN